MQAEFFKDENGFIWFFYASNIQVRKNLSKSAVNSEEAKKEAKKLASNKEKMRKQMINELEEYETQQKLSKNAATQKMLGVMNQYYSTLKNEVGIQQ